MFFQKTGLIPIKQPNRKYRKYFVNPAQSPTKACVSFGNQKYKKLAAKSIQPNPYIPYLSVDVATLLMIFIPFSDFKKSTIGIAIME
jgi:hypothetical protein